MRACVDVGRQAGSGDQRGPGPLERQPTNRYAYVA
jgi:hypothetical protein